METAPRKEYERRRQEGLAAASRLDGWSGLLGNGRVLLVVVALVFAVRAWTTVGEHPWTLYYALGALFVVSLIAQGRVDRRRLRFERRVTHYARALDRLDGKWTDFPSRGDSFAEPTHAYAKDLDVLGRGSLFQLLDTTRTAQGAATLAKWLLSPASSAEIAERRASVEALRPEIDVREDLALSGDDSGDLHVDPSRVIRWGEGEPLMPGGTALRLAATVLPIVTIAMLFAMRADIVPVWSVLVLLAGHLVFINRTRAYVGALAAVAERTEKTLNRVLPMLQSAAGLPEDTSRLASLKERLTGAVGAASALQRRVTVFQSRGNLIVAVISPLVLWDIHAAFLLQGWQRRHGRELRGWFDALGELEALAAFATYAYEHPDDTFASVKPGAALLRAVDLGHPLIAPDKCVRNDVALGGPGTVLLVTGSNMSGKSTLLRSVGLNAVMALAGLPVRAKSMELSELQIASSMRVADSLLEGSSLFHAELVRLKSVVDNARGDRPLLFLLDEILHGTNTRERSLGAQAVITALVESGAMGMVSTHDLSLVQMGERLGDRVSYAHFTDQVEGDRMTFDYRMRPGVVQTSNALRLMKALGLPVESVESGPASLLGAGGGD